MGKAKKRVNPKVTSRVNQKLKKQTLKQAIRFARKLPPPWKWSGTGRKPRYDGTLIAVLCLWLVACNFTYDELAEELGRSYVKRILGVRKLPSRSTVNRGMLRLSQKYIRRFNKIVVGRLARKRMTVVLDSTGIRLVTSSAWYDIRIGRRNRRRDNKKFHIATETRRNCILEYKITCYRRHDSPQLKFLLRDIDELLRVLGDAGYISRANCDIVVKKKGKPFFAIKKNTTAKKKGSAAYRDMVKMAKFKEELFKAVYHMRSVVEAVFSSLKKRYGNCIRAVKCKAKNNNLALRVVAYNIKQLLYDRMARNLGVPFWVKCGQ